MITRILKFTFLFVGLYSFSQEEVITEKHEYKLYSKNEGEVPITMQKTILEDTLRNRSIPIIVYYPKSDSIYKHQRLVIINHGYDKNRPNSYLNYSFLGTHLASKGYFVVSIQNDLASDDSLPMNGNLLELRRPSWEKAIQNMKYTIKDVRNVFPQVDSSDLTLIGHSNGGDACILFATLYPNEVTRVVTLDHRRMPIPKANNPKIMTVRSSDQVADEGVIPTDAELTQYGIFLIKMEDMLHNEMCDQGSKEKRAELLYSLDQFLLEN